MSCRVVSCCAVPAVCGGQQHACFCTPGQPTWPGCCLAYKASVPLTSSLLPAPLHAGVIGLELMMSKDGTTSNRGFGFLEFYNHACADKARKHLTDTNFKYAPELSCC